MESGQVVAGKYRLNQLLGKGGMAEVWSATNTFTERQIAIKFMNAQVAKTPEAAARFLKEAKVSARVNHPNIIDILDVGQTEDGQLFLVMELLTGLSLEVALRRQTPAMTQYELALVMLEVAQALAAAHRSGIVHRDLKPTNIFLHRVRDGIAIPKLLDFGVSKFLEDDQNQALTVAGTVLGSPLYMSPEQARGDAQLDGRTDVFAFGAILFEALCGFRAYDAKNFNALIVKIATTRPKDIDACAREHALEIPESFRAVVRACLEPDLKKRAATFDEVIAHLRAALPALEASKACLPPTAITTASPDVEATNALPVVRAGERTGSGPPGSVPPPPNLGSVPPGSISAYPSSGVTGPSWHTPNTSYASTKADQPRRTSTAWLVGAAAALVASGVGLGAGLGWRARSAAHVPSSPREAQETQLTAGQTVAVTTGAATPSGSAHADTPVVSVDALPVASAKPLAPPPRGAGRLFVSAAPGWCMLSVDGVVKGPTPLAGGLDLAAGAHQLRCEGPGNKVHVASVTVQDGGSTRFRFALED